MDVFFSIVSSVVLMLSIVGSKMHTEQTIMYIFIVNECLRDFVCKFMYSASRPLCVLLIFL